jgi:hypothetical protein
MGYGTLYIRPFVALFGSDCVPIGEENFFTGRIFHRSFSINVLHLTGRSRNGQKRLIFLLLRGDFGRRIIGLSVSFVSSGYSGSAEHLSGLAESHTRPDESNQ